MTPRRDLFLAALAVAVILAIVALLASGGFRRADATPRGAVQPRVTLAAVSPLTAERHLGAPPLVVGAAPVTPDQSVAVPDAGGAPPPGEVGTALYSASATWCAPTPTQCQSWGGNARLAAVNSFRFGDEPYPVRVWRGDAYVDVTVVSFCACRGTMHAIDLSPSAFRVLEPDLSRGRIDVEVEVLTDLAPDPRDDRMRDEVRDPLPATDVAP